MLDGSAFRRRECGIEVGPASGAVPSFALGGGESVVVGEERGYFDVIEGLDENGLMFFLEESCKNFDSFAIVVVVSDVLVSITVSLVED